MKTHATRTRTRANAVLYTVTLAAALLGGCNTPLEARNEQAGTVVGAVVIGLLDTQPAHGPARDVATDGN